MDDLQVQNRGYCGGGSSEEVEVPSIVIRGSGSRGTS